MTNKYRKQINIKLAELRFFLSYNGLYLTVVGVIIGLFILTYLLSIPDRNRIEKQNELKGIAIGTIAGISPQGGYGQSLTGSHKITVTNIVTYTFIVEGKYYSGINKIRNTNLIEYNNDGNIVVKYMIGYPEKSYIKLKE